jgi:hypothetical protein
MSAWMPAPPPLSDPAITRTRAIIDDVSNAVRVEPKS